MKMDDIARLAGVSKSAVSIAMSGKPGIGTDTRERILQIAKEHGYNLKSRPIKPEAASKALTFLVLANSGIVLDKYYQQPFFRELIHYIEERCRSKGYSLLFSTVDIGQFDHDISSFAEEVRTEGVILLGTNLSSDQIRDIAASIPHLVVLDTCYDTLPVHFVEINNFMGGYQAGTHLTDNGHKRIGYLASDVRIHNFEERKRGFLAALKEAGIADGPAPVFTAAPTILSSQDELKQQIEGVLRSGSPLPTAFFCECDYMAISAIKTLTELGIRIPEDVSVVGFDNISESVIVTPELTTIHVEKERMAKLAVDLLIDSLDRDTTAATKTKVDTTLVERLSSTRIPRG